MVSTIQFPLCPALPAERMQAIPCIASPIDSNAVLCSRRNERSLRAWRVRLENLTPGAIQLVLWTLRETHGAALALAFTPSGESEIDARALGQSYQFSVGGLKQGTIEFDIEEVR